MYFVVFPSDDAPPVEILFLKHFLIAIKSSRQPFDINLFNNNNLIVLFSSLNVRNLIILN